MHRELPSLDLVRVLIVLSAEPVVHTKNEIVTCRALRTVTIGRRRLIRPAAYAACVDQLDNKAA